MEDAPKKCLRGRVRNVYSEVAERLSQDHQPPIPSELFSGQNWKTGGRTSRCPLSGFLKSLPTAHLVEMYRLQG